MNKELVIVFGFSRTGTSSLEIALQNLGYNTINVDAGRSQKHNYENIYNTILKNIKENKKNIFDNVPNEYNAFIMGCNASDKNNIINIQNKFPHAKFIMCDREHNSWVISMKNHQLVANRPNPKRQELIQNFENWKNKIRDVLKNNKNFIEMNVSLGDKYEKLCKFLNKKIPKTPYPSISTNKKLKLTKEQINY